MSAHDRIDEMVKTNKVLLFMKGSPDLPQCGFSMRAVSVVRALDVPFESFDVLSDPEIRQGIKEYAKWPTIPQLYINGEFVGGSDIVMQMWESGELETMAKGNG